MGYGSIILELRRDKKHPLSNKGALLELVMDMLDIAYESGVREGLSDLRTVRCNLRSTSPAVLKSIRTYLDYNIARLEERIGEREPERFKVTGKGIHRRVVKVKKGPKGRS